MSAVLDHASELEKLLLEHDVTVFGYERAGDIAIVRFTLNDQKLRLVVGMPDWNDAQYTTTDTGRPRADSARRQLYWADVKRNWKAMRDLVAAKLAAIEVGITTFENEFQQFEDGVALLGEGAQD